MSGSALDQCLRRLRSLEEQSHDFGAGSGVLTYLFDACRDLEQLETDLPRRVRRRATSRCREAARILSRFDETDRDSEQVDPLGSDEIKALEDIGSELQSVAALARAKKDHKSARERFIEAAKEYKEVVLIVLAVLAVVGLFATKDDLNNNIDRIECILTTKHSQLDNANRITAQYLEIQKLTRAANRISKNPDATDDERKEALRELDEAETILIDLKRQRSKIENQLSSIQIQSSWERCGQ